MRTFHCKLDLVKSTERKFRWDEDIDGTKFELYIPQRQVPNPPPQMISVKICDATVVTGSRLSELNPREPTQGDMLVLDRIGLSGDQIRQAAGHAILAAVYHYEDHTQTVRYRPFGDQNDWEIGEPYVPISELGNPYPERLVFLIEWVPN